MPVHSFYNHVFVLPSLIHKVRHDDSIIVPYFVFRQEVRPLHRRTPRQRVQTMGDVQKRCCGCIHAVMLPHNQRAARQYKNTCN
jgi:hypothetical protein